MAMLTSLRTTVPAEVAIEQKMALAASSLVIRMTKEVEGIAGSEEVLRQEKTHLDRESQVGSQTTSKAEEVDVSLLDREINVDVGGDTDLPDCQNLIASGIPALLRCGNVLGHRPVGRL